MNYNIKKEMTFLLCVINNFTKEGFATCYSNKEITMQELKETKTQFENNLKEGFSIIFKSMFLPTEYAEKHIEFKIINNEIITI